ncbi:hypothetical protein VNO77_00572 [Canavalia gladiata]|uniref:Protein LURP-one-related 4 n=1 Tax=Canavalia gladiata TaxID=3824 RepID=A0AAN9MPV9_CANGL
MVDLHSLFRPKSTDPELHNVITIMILQRSLARCFKETGNKVGPGRHINKVLKTIRFTEADNTTNPLLSMAKVYPQELTTSSQCLTSKRETYTLWMKSLVFHSNGCTVYDSNGDIVYRVDNYDRKGRREVNLMDLRGKVLCTIKKRLLAFGCWEGHRCNSSNCRSQEQPWFQVKRMIKGKVACQITVGCQKYSIIRTGAKAAAFRIVNIDGQIVAEAKQKHSASGVVLSNDVLTLDLAAGTDHSLIMGLVTVYGLICGIM